MVYILEIKTTQAAAMKIVVDAINSLLTDANFEFRPYYIDDDDEDNTAQKKIGGVVLKEINKTGIIFNLDTMGDLTNLFLQQCPRQLKNIIT